MYEVFVGGLRTVYYGNSRRQARRAYSHWANKAQRHHKRVTVTAFKCGFVVAQFFGGEVMDLASLMEA